jgi:DNA-binding Lrp family transcriptional regulator
MQVTNLKTEEAKDKAFAWQDARMRNIANQSTYPQAVQIRAERMKMVLTLVYTAKNVYTAYGKTGVSIKVDGAIVTDAKSLEQLEADWALQGVTKKVSAQGVIYRFKQ